jgi:quinol---cytochrome c reductase iron-sulfur subunit
VHGDRQKGPALVTRLKDWLVAGTVLLLGKAAKPHRDRERIVEPGPKEPRSELAIIGLFGLSSLSAVAFIVVYALDRLPYQTQLLGLTIGLSLTFLAAALIATGKQLVVEEENEEEYPEENEEEQEQLEQIVEESGSRITRKRLFGLAAGGAAGSLGLAAITPVLSFGPLLDVDPLFGTPWKKGRRLVDEELRPMRAADIEPKVFYTAFPEGGNREDLGAPLIVVRLHPAEIKVRQDWAPQGILAYSKICTHAGCAISLYRTPKFAPVEPKPAFVCPCHYSTFDPADGGRVLFGPAGRRLPQLPLAIGKDGFLRAAGNFSGPIGPSWWGVRNRKANP